MIGSEAAEGDAAFKPRPARGASVLQSLDNGLDVLSLFVSGGRATLDVPFVMRVLGLTRSTTYRLVRKLAERGFLERGARRGSFRVGPVIGLLMLHRDALANIAHSARPLLERIVRRTGETAFLTVREGCFAHCIDFVESPEAVRLSVQRGSRIALHGGASGQIFLAYMPREEVNAYVAQPLLAYTGETVTDPESLRRLLRAIRASGYALSENQTGAGTIGLCVPVSAALGRIVAGLTLAAPSFRMSADALLTHLPLLREAAAELTEQLPDGS